MTPLLSAIVFLPALGALAIMASPRERPGLARGLAAGFSGAALLLVVILFVLYNRADIGMQFVEKAAWVPTLGISYFLGVDGLNLPMVLLTALLSLLAVVASWQISLRPKEYFAILLVLESGVLGVFLALDLVLFFLFWEVELIPMYLLIGIWGGPRREYAATKFVIYTLLGSALMLIGILALYFQQAGSRTFDMVALSQQKWDSTFAIVAFVFLFLGFAIKLPVFPFHTWLPHAHVEAPTAVSVILAGVLLKMGGYGILRVGVGILPTAVTALAGVIAILAVINVLYGAMLSIVQKDLKALVAYSSISHMGYVLLGVAGITVVGLSGASIQMFTHGAITGLLFLLVGLVYDRTHTRTIADMTGLAPRLPLIAIGFVVASLASLGLPGLAGFVGEFTVFVGAFQRAPAETILAAVGIVLTAGYMLWMLQRVFFGPASERWSGLADVRGLDLIPVVSLVAVIVVVGVYPAVLTDVVANGARVIARGLGI